MRGLAFLAALERLPLRGRAAVVPGRLDEQPAGVTGAGLGDRALAGVSRRELSSTGTSPR